MSSDLGIQLDNVDLPAPATTETTPIPPNSTSFSVSYDTHAYQKKELNLYYFICEVLVAVTAVAGNALVIYVFCKERRLRRRTNYYIVSLAAADLLVGLLGIPFAVMSSVGLPSDLHACLFTVSLLVVLCTISIFCLVAVSVDRYWAILHPMGYSRNVRTKTALVIISICWFAGTVIGLLPLMGWRRTAPQNGDCFFLYVMDYNYLVFLYFGTIITPALLLAACYAHIYRVVLKQVQLRQIVTMNPETGTMTPGCSSGGTMLRMLGAAQKREVKATQNLSIIVLFFMICWIPLYTINCAIAFGGGKIKIHPTFMLFCIILSHVNSAGNPLLYAYHLKDFRAALKSFFYNLCGRIEHARPNRNSIMSNLSKNRTGCNLRDRKMYNYSDSKLYYRNKLDNNLGKNSRTLVRNSTLPNDMVGRVKEIWKISESDSSESFKDSSHRDPDKGIVAIPVRPLMITYRMKIRNEVPNPNGLEDSSDDDIFQKRLVKIAENKSESSGEEFKTNQGAKCLSNSSPQLSNLFLIDDDRRVNQEFTRSCSLIDPSKVAEILSEKGKYTALKKIALSPIKIFKCEKTYRSKSTSDDSLSSNESTIKNNGIILTRNSCG